MNNSSDLLAQNKIEYTDEQKATNVEKALEYFLTQTEKNLFVVGHSIFMKKLYKEEFKKKNNTILDDKFKEVKQQNVWSYIFDLKNSTNSTNSKLKKIIFTRHAFSVANLYKERVSTHLLGKYTKFVDKSFYNQQMEKDAKLSLYGIISTIKYSKKFAEKIEKKEINVSNDCTIIVSCLIRTWMTALCLYLPIIKSVNNNLTINLVIGDYIKEDGSTPDNTPEKIDLQIKNITLFLKFLKDYKLMSDVFKNNVNVNIKFDTRTVEIKIPVNNKLSVNNNKNLEYYRLWKSDREKSDQYKNKIIEMISNNKMNSENLNITPNLTPNPELPKKSIFKKFKNFTSTKTEPKFVFTKLKILTGIKKPTEEELKDISRWLEPFSKKGSNSYSLTGQKKVWRNSKKSNGSIINNISTTNSYVSNLTNGGKKTTTKKTVKTPVKKTTTKKTVKSPVKKTTTKKTVKSPVKKTKTKKTVKSPVKKTTTKKTVKK